MKKRTKFTVCAAALLAGAIFVRQMGKKADAADTTKEQEEEKMVSPSTTGALHVEGCHLTDKDGKTVQLKGISTHGISWYPQFINKECFAQFHDEWKANLMRIAMYTAEEGGYCTDGDKDYLKELVCRGVEAATANDMYVIIDWHILFDSNPNMHIEEAEAFFDEMSAKYKDFNNVFYEICNEPNGDTTWQDVKDYAKVIIETIRANDKDGIIIVGTPCWCQFVDQAAADPITGYDNIMYSLHYYAATHKEDLRQRMKDAMDAGLPIFVTEYGICDASGNGVLDIEQANAWVEAMNEYGISCAMWNLSNRDESSAIVKADCEKTSGFTMEDLNDSGKWIYEMLTGAENPGADIQSSGANFLSNGFSVSISLTNSWESEGKPFKQYAVTMRNTGADCESWSIEIPFTDAIELSDGWNGEYTVEGTTLRIASKDYNGAVTAGGAVVDVGFIVSGDGQIAQEEE